MSRGSLGGWGGLALRLLGLILGKDYAAEREDQAGCRSGSVENHWIVSEMGGRSVEVGSTGFGGVRERAVGIRYGLSVGSVDIGFEVRKLVGSNRSPGTWKVARRTARESFAKVHATGLATRIDERLTGGRSPEGLLARRSGE